MVLVLYSTRPSFLILFSSLLSDDLCMPSLSAKSFLEMGNLIVLLFWIRTSYRRKSRMLVLMVFRDIALIFSVKTMVLSEIDLIKSTIKRSLLLQSRMINSLGICRMIAGAEATTVIG